VANELVSINSERTLTPDQYRISLTYLLSWNGSPTSPMQKRDAPVSRCRGIRKLSALPSLFDYLRTLNAGHAATNALSNEADIAKVQEWLGHANVSTTRLYERRKARPEDSPTFHVKY
jgi:integrase